MKRNLFIIFLFAVVQLVFAKPGDSFLLKILSDSEKSALVTNKGKESYRIYLQQNQDMTYIETVKEYFVMALKLDPDNQEAKTYLERVNTYKTRQSTVMLNSAVVYFEKKNKTLRDEFNLCYFIQKALEADPKNKDALKLKLKNRAIYKKVVDHYLQQGKEAKDSYKQDGEFTRQQEKIVLNALESFGTVLLIDPENSLAKNEKHFFESLLLKEMQNCLKDASDLVKRGLYKTCRLKLVKCWEYSKKLGWKMSKEITEVEYVMNYRWALSEYRKNNFDLALAKINRALKIKRTGEANRLLKTILDKQQSTEVAESFDSIVELIDDLIVGNDLVGAKKKIDATRKDLKNEKQIQQLDEKMKEIFNKLDPLYEQARSAYNNEQFQNAINIFQIILAINPEFKDAGQYYEKAIQKQKTLDAF